MNIFQDHMYFIIGVPRVPQMLTDERTQRGNDTNRQLSSTTVKCKR